MVSTIEMTLSEVLNILNAKVICGESKLNQAVDSALASDLMSDVLTVEADKAVLITGLANTQAVRTAEMSDIPCVIFVRNKKVNEEICRIAMEGDIVLAECEYSMFKAAGILYAVGIKPVY